MADSLCGPSNGAKNLVGHVDRDRSLQQDRMINGLPANAQSTFRSQTANASSADHVFASFQQNGLMEPTNPMPLAAQLPIPQSQYMGRPGFAGAPAFQNRGPDQTSSFAPAVPGSQDWVSQFSGMQIESPAAHLHAPTLSQPHHPVSSINNAPFTNMSLHSGFAGGSFARPFPSFQPAATMMAPNPVSAFADQSQALGAQYAGSSLDTEAFNRAFGEYDEVGFLDDVAKWAADGAAEAESQLATKEQVSSETQQVAVEPAQEETQKQEPVNDNTINSDVELANAANAILNSVRENDSEKFKNSNFFELMRRIGNYEVVVNGPNLVDAATGEAVAKPEGDDASA